MNTNPLGSQYTIEEYQVLLMMEEEKRILVEGSSDKHLFELLIDEIKVHKKSEISQQRVSFIVESSDLIDAKEIFNKGEKRKISNREKVEKICKILEQDPNSHKLIGFVDREFREFEYSSEVLDKIQCHCCKERILWTRGHSIENYFFEHLVLREIIKLKIAENWFGKVVSLFDKYFNACILIACAIGITAKNNSQINKVQQSIHWQMFEIEEKKLKFNTDIWAIHLIERQSLNLDKVEKLKSDFADWIAKLKDADYTVLRWLCHGHIGHKCTFSFFYFCISQICPSESKPEKYANNFRDKEYFNACALFWVKRALDGQCEHPFDSFRQLGLEIL